MPTHKEVRIKRRIYTLYFLCIFGIFVNIPNIEMAKLSAETKKRITTVVNLAKTIFHIGFVPTVLYLGKELFYHAFHKVNSEIKVSSMKK